MKSKTIALAIGLLAGAPVLSEPASFDLTGPTLEVTVTRGAATLPISQVPNLAAGDRLSIRGEFEDGYAVHYMLVAAFLRGPTDPPPEKWFFRCDTWKGKCRKDGLTLTVPKEAQQLLLFLAPETGGDYATLMDAVRGRPGVFVRTSMELNQAAQERMRLQVYLQAVRHLGESDPTRLKEAAPLLSRSLAIRVDDKCLQKTPTQQAACLMQGQESLIMADGRSESVTQQLTSGPASDLAMEASNTPQLKSGYYGPFVGSVLDIARLLDSFHTAKYQYIPALGAPSGRDLALALNAPPSFHDPKSVLVAALPPIESPQSPQLRPLDTKAVYCARKSPLLLPAEGAPMMFAGGYAHGLSLRVSGAGGTALELPAAADAAQGGFLVDTSALHAASLGAGAHGSLHGQWGFERYDGPSFALVDAPAQAATVAPADAAALIVGRQDTVHLLMGSSACLSDIGYADSAGTERKVEWKPVPPDEVEAKLSLEDAAPGDVTLLIRQFGSAAPQRLTLHSYSAAAHLEAFALHSGDREGVLRGERLDEVATLTLGDTEFAPESLASTGGHDELTLLGTASPGSLKEGDKAKAHVKLKDGRAYDVGVAVLAPRPSATLIGKSIEPTAASEERNIELASADELPQGAQVRFALHALTPAAFSRDDRVEVATVDGSWSAVLGPGSGLTLENSKVAVVTLDPAKAFGPAAFGPLRFRLVSALGSGDWQSLATLVRLPQLTQLDCSGSSEAPCRLSGLNLFLLDSVSRDPGFAAPTAIPDGFTGQSLSVPRPANGRLYVKLRDDPSVVSVAVMSQPAAAQPETSHAGSPSPDSKEPVAAQEH